MRAFAEWEEQELIFLALPHKNSDWAYVLEDITLSYRALVQALANFQRVVLLSPFREDYDKYFKDIKNTVFLEIPTNDTWIRDYGAIDFKDGDKIKSYDFIFNAWGNKFLSYKDNLVNKELFRYLKGELIEVPFIFEGGSIDFNGKGTALTTSRCIFNENRNHEKSREKITEKIKKLFGLEKLIILEHGFLLGDDTDAHVDTLARFVDEETIAYCSCDEDDEHYPELKKMEDELQKTGFKLLPIPLPKPIYEGERRLGATYINFIFINGAFIMPAYETESDEKARKLFASVIKDREIILVDANKFILQNGSLHCASQNRFLGLR